MQQVGAEQQVLQAGAAQAGSQAAVQPLPQAFPQGAAQAASQAVVQPLPQPLPHGAAQAASQGEAQQLDSQGDEQQLLVQHFFLWQSNRPFSPQNRSCEWQVLTPQCEQPHFTPPAQHDGSQQLLVQLLQALPQGAAQPGSHAVVQPLPQPLPQGAAQPGSQAVVQPLPQPFPQGAAQPGSHAVAQQLASVHDDFSQHFGAQHPL